MEFEDNRPTSDEDRRLAEAKKLTLQPIHNDVIPEDFMDDESATVHNNGQAIANISNDTEVGVYIQPSQSYLDAHSNNTQKSSNKLMIGIIAASVSFSSLALLAFLK